MQKRSSAFPLILILVGSIWFLNSTGLMPSTPMILSVLLIVAGLSIWVMDGWSKNSLVSATMFIYSGCAIYASSEYHLRSGHLISLGFVLAGILMLLAKHPSIPEKKNRKELLHDDYREHKEH
jgi:hypothetical protein